MPRAGLEPTIPAFEREKRVHALDRAAAVSGIRVVLPDSKNEVIPCTKHHAMKTYGVTDIDPLRHIWT
jgi:hypothetical protein